MAASFESSCESRGATREETGRKGPLARIADKIRILSRNARHRKEIRRLADFSDAQLNDIGLKRDDLRSALHLDISYDPTTYLAEQARSRRVTIRRRGQ